MWVYGVAEMVVAVVESFCVCSWFILCVLGALAWLSSPALCAC